MNTKIKILKSIDLDPDTYDVSKIKRGTILDVKSRIEYTLRELGLTYKYDFTVFPNQYNCHVVINRDLIINDPNMSRLPFKIHKVKGNCDIIGGNLTTLTSTPNEVEGYFNVSGNQLTSLGYFPTKVGGGIYIQNNQIKKLTNIPEHIKGDFNCSGNKLASLNGGPSKVDGVYECSGNKLKNLDHTPDTHPRIFDCSDNPIEDFSSVPNESLVYSNPHKIPDHIIANKNLRIQTAKVTVEAPNIDYEAPTESELEEGYHDED